MKKLSQAARLAVCTVVAASALAVGAVGVSQVDQGASAPSSAPAQDSGW